MEFAIEGGRSPSTCRHLSVTVGLFEIREVRELTGWTDSWRKPVVRGSSTPSVGTRLRKRTYYGEI